MQFIYGITLFWMFFAQGSLATPATNTGPVALGARLTMGLTNSILKSDTIIPVRCIIKNSSTNLIYLFNPPDHFEETTVTLISSSGTEYTLSPGFGVGSTRSAIEVAPKDEHPWTMPLTFGKNVQPGEYRLHIKRWIMLRSLDKTIGADLTCDLPGLHVE
jgi:hypothetical protein